MNKEIKLIIFDCYGLILNEGYPNTAKLLVKKYGGSYKKYMDVLYYKYLNQAATRKITQKDAWVMSVKDLNLPITWQQLRSMHYKLMKVEKRIFTLNLELNKKGYMTLMLSKNTRSQLNDVSKRFGFKKQFKNIINTWELDLPKASKKTLRLIFKRFKVKPEEVVCADDQMSNLVDAQEMGAKIILVKNYNQFKRDLDRYLAE